MLVALCLRYQSDLVITTPWEKMTNTQKTPSFFTNTKIYSPLHFLVAVEKEETAYEKWVVCISETKRNKMSCAKTSRHRLWIIFLIFSCSSNTCVFASFIFITLRWVWDPFWELRLKWGLQISIVFTLSWLIFNCCLHIIASSCQLTLFLFSIPCPLLTSFPVWVSFCQSIFNLAVPNYFTQGLSFRFLWVLPCDQLGWQSLLFSRFSLFCWLSLGLVVWLRYGDLFVSQNCREVSVSHFPGQILVCAYTICWYGQIWTSCTIPSGLPSWPSLVLSCLILLFH